MKVRNPGFNWWPIALLATGSIVVALWWLPARHSTETTTPHPAPPTAPPAATPRKPESTRQFSMARATYVGEQACAECHSKRVHEFAATAHHRAARLPEEHDVAGNFTPGNNVYQPRNPDLRFEMLARDDGYFQQRTKQTSEGRQTETRKVDLIYGTGLLDEIYLYWDDNRVYEMPIAWVNPLDRWINAPGYVDGHGDFSHGAHLCLNCHNTHLDPIPGRPKEFNRENMVASVSCERCHGPGSEHIAYHRMLPEDTDGAHIVHPGHLSRKRQLDLCVQCHGDHGQPRKPLFSYRPGEPLEAFFVTLKHERHPEDEHTANQLRYLAESRCFQESPSLSCITCHNPHKPEGPQNSASPARSCLNCHQPDHCTEGPGLPAAVRGACIDCHMPRRTDMHTAFHGPDGLLIPGRPRAEHRIAIHPEASKAVLIRYLKSQSDAGSQQTAATLAPEVGEKLIAKARQLAEEHHFATSMGLYRDALEFAPNDKRIPAALDELKQKRERVQLAFNAASRAEAAQSYEEAIHHLRETLEIKPNFAPAHHLLGKAFQGLNDHEQAIRHFMDSLDLDPNQSDPHDNMGVSFQIMRDTNKAIEEYRLALELNPMSSESHNNLALALRTKDNLNGAMQHYKKALEFDSQNASAHNNLGSLLYRMGRTEDSMASYRKAIELMPGFADAHFNLANSLRRNTAYAEAIEHYRKAVENRPDHFDARHNAATLLMITGQHSEALKHFEELLRARPNSILHMVLTARLLAGRAGSTDEERKRALELAQAAAGIVQRQDPGVLETLALAHAGTGDFETAARVADEAAVLADQNPNGAQQAAAIRNLKEACLRKELPTPESLFPSIKPAP